MELAALEDGGWSIARYLEVIPDGGVSSSTPSLRATAVAAERELQKLRGKVDTTPPTSASGRAQRPDNDHTSAVAPSTNGSGRTASTRTQPRRDAVRRSGTRRRRHEPAKEGQEQGQEQLRVQAESALPSADPIRNVLGSAGELLPGSLYMGRSFGPHGQPEGCSHGPDAGEHGEAVREYRERHQLRNGSAAVLVIARPIFLVTSTGRLPASHSRPCHVWRLPKLGGLSLAVAALHIRAHVGWLTWAWGLLPRGKWKAAPSGRRSEACCLFRSHLPRHAIPRLQTWPWPRLRYKERRTHAFGEDAWLNLSQ